ncbi:MAG: hypothetical protein ABFE08_23585 [Armatimonadia bacterium]
MRQRTYRAYDARNLLSALTDPLGQTVYYERDELGREVAKALPNGVTTYHNYDIVGQVESIIHQGPSGVLQSLYYTYDTDGQRTKIEREDGTRVYFGYDAAHRLTGEDWLDPSDAHIYGFAYEYDAAGNRLRKTFNGEVTYYDYNNLNQLTTERVLGGEATYYTWTPDGAMATKQDGEGWTYYTWDVDESLKKIDAPNVTLENKYNARMQRVWRSEDGNGESLVYDAQKLVAEATTGGLERYYLSEGGSVYSPLVSQLGSQHWFLFDALGTTLGLTDRSGGLSDTFKCEAFGTSLGRTGVTETPGQWLAAYQQYAEAPSGLSCGVLGWYDASVARGAARLPRHLTSLDLLPRPFIPKGVISDLFNEVGMSVCQYILKVRQRAGKEHEWTCVCGIAAILDLIPVPVAPLLGLIVEPVDCLCNIGSTCDTWLARKSPPWISITATTIDCISVVANIPLGPLGEIGFDLFMGVAQQIDQGWPFRKVPAACCTMLLEGLRSRR